MARGGVILRGALVAMRDAVRPGISTLELDTIGGVVHSLARGRRAGVQGALWFPGQRVHLD